ncbi:MAG TPA: hypothetical protein VFC90_04670 [Planctomycetota bacterium]|nr:hypothetical protein [Planctomycetota bacterium]
MKKVHPYDETDALPGCAGPFLVVWLCGWAVGEYVLWATMFGADLHWRGGHAPPLWSLIIFTAVWTAGGLWAIRLLIRMWRSRI